jgi:hypothetical protein
MQSTRYSCKTISFSKNLQILNFMKILLFGAEQFHVDGWTDRHEEANSRLSRLCECAQK